MFFFFYNLFDVFTTLFFLHYLFLLVGNFHWTPEDVAKSILCMLMSGPCLTGYTQVWFW